MQLTFRYGKGEVGIEVPDARVLDRIALPGSRPVDDVGAELTRALAAPVGLRLEDVVQRGDRVLLMTVDHTRPNPGAFLWPLAERIEALGATASVIAGLGIHRQMTAEELQSFYGTTEILQPDSRSADQWRAGTTSFGTPVEVCPLLREFDKRIVVGFVEPQYIAGFSGGRKMVIPSVASYDAVTHNHFLTLLKAKRLGILDGNPVHEDLMQAAEIVGLDYVCDAVVNPDDSIAAIHCGDWIAAHRAACEDSARIYRHAIPGLADIVIASPGGHPYDVDMVQAKKALVPAMDCVREGGVIILVGECRRGWGADTPDMSLLHAEEAPAKIAAMRAGIQTGRCEWHWGPSSTGLMFADVVLGRKARLIVVSTLQDELAGTIATAAPDLVTALEMAEETVGREAKVIAIGDGRRTVIGASPPGPNGTYPPAPSPRAMLYPHLFSDSGRR